MFNKTAIMPAMRIEPNIKAALEVLAAHSPGDVNDQVRFASERLVKDRILELELRIAGAEQVGLVDALAHEYLQALRAAYASPSEN